MVGRIRVPYGCATFLKNLTRRRYSQHFLFPLYGCKYKLRLKSLVIYDKCGRGVSTYRSQSPGTSLWKVVGRSGNPCKLPRRDLPFQLWENANILIYYFKLLPNLCQMFEDLLFQLLMIDTYRQEKFNCTPCELRIRLG